MKFDILKRIVGAITFVSLLATTADAADVTLPSFLPGYLKQLEIPRSTDPTCPYSYSSGLDRLDQKTLKLSDGVKQALTKLKAGSLP